MPHPSVGVDADETLDVVLYAPSQIPFYGILRLEERRNTGDFIGRQVFGSHPWVQIQFFNNLHRLEPPDSIDVGEGDLKALVIGYIGTYHSRH
jgi:hypothetical protein